MTKLVALDELLNFVQFKTAFMAAATCEEELP